MMVQDPEEVGEGLEVPTDTHHTPIVTQPSSSPPLKKQKSRRKQRKGTEVPHIKPQTEESVPTTSNDPLPSGEDRMQLTELMNLCTKLSDRILSLEQINTNQAAEIKKLKKRVKKLEGKKKKRTHGLKRMYKVGLSARIVSSDEEDQGRMNKEDLFRVNDLDGDEVIVDLTARDEIEQESAKRQRLENEDDSTELQRCLEIVLEDDDDVTIEATPLSSKSPTTVDYKIYNERKKSYFRIIRADGNLQNYLTFGKMFKNFNREDLEVL
nr:hypothetical protein [Tanacetum cinerariifolium]